MVAGRRPTQGGTNDSPLGIKFAGKHNESERNYANGLCDGRIIKINTTRAIKPASMPMPKKSSRAGMPNRCEAIQQTILKKGELRR